MRFHQHILQYFASINMYVLNVLFDLSREERLNNNILHQLCTNHFFLLVKSNINSLIKAR